MGGVLKATDHNSASVLLVAMEMVVVAAEGGGLQAGSDYNVSQDTYHNIS